MSSPFSPLLDSIREIPQVTASDITQMWTASRRIRAEMAGAQSAMGLGAYAGLGVEAAAGGPQRFLPVMLRHAVLVSLTQRGILQDYMHGDEPDERVFVAAATMPLDKDDVAEAAVQLQLSQSPPDVVEQARREMLPQGYDVAEPQIDAKFRAWLRDNG